MGAARILPVHPNNLPESMAKNHLSRRDFLLRLGAVGALGVGAGTLVSACGGGESRTTPAPEAAPDAAATAEVRCDDVSALTADELRMRNEAYKYVDVTPDPQKRCDNCALYVAAAAGAACGTCTLVKGPIAPGGHCLSWAPKQTM
jgi:hypothetical protein